MTQKEFAWTTILLISVWFVGLPLVVVALPTAPDAKALPDASPVQNLTPIDPWTHYLMALLGALTAAIPIFVQAWKNGTAAAQNKTAIEEARVAQARLHNALAEKFGWPPLPIEAPPIPPPKTLSPQSPSDKLDQILSLLTTKKEP